MNIDKIIFDSLNKAGLTDIPDDRCAELYNHGMDSLMVVLVLAELEKTLEKNIPSDHFSESKFKSINSIKLFLEESGVI